MPRAATTVAAAVLGFAAVGLGAVAGAEPGEPRARLALAVDSGLVGCPSAAELKSAVGARLGYDPFREPATREILVRIRRTGSGIVGAIELRGPEPGRRTIESETGDCSAVADALATAIAISIDPAVFTRPPPSSSSAPSPSVPSANVPPGKADAPEPIAPTAASAATARAPAAAQPASPPIAHRAEAVRFGLELGPRVVLGELPRPAVGLALGIVLEGRRLRLGLEATALSPVNGTSAAGDFRASSLDAALVPCARLPIVQAELHGCAVARIATVRAEPNDVEGGLAGRGLQSALGARLALVRSFGESLTLGLHAEASAPLGAVVIRLRDREVFRTEALLARFGFVAGLVF